MGTNVLSYEFQYLGSKGKQKNSQHSHLAFPGNLTSGAKCQESRVVAEEGHRGTLGQKRQGRTVKVTTGRQPGDKSRVPREEDPEPTKKRKARA